MSDALTAVFEEMKKRYKPGVVDRPMTFYFSLGNGPGQKWTMTLSPDAIEVRAGKTENADVFLKTSQDRFMDLISGKWTPNAMDFMRKKISSNDPLKLPLLKDCFDAP